MRAKLCHIQTINPAIADKKKLSTRENNLQTFTDYLMSFKKNINKNVINVMYELSWLYAKNVCQKCVSNESLVKELRPQAKKFIFEYNQGIRLNKKITLLEDLTNKEIAYNQTMKKLKYFSANITKER